MSTATFLFCLFVCFLFEKVVGREHLEKVSKNRSAVSKCSLKEIISTLFYEQRAVCTVECTLAMRKSTSIGHYGFSPHFQPWIAAPQQQWVVSFWTHASFPFHYS